MACYIYKKCSRCKKRNMTTNKMCSLCRKYMLKYTKKKK